MDESRIAPLAQVVVTPGTERRYYDVWTAPAEPPEMITTALCAEPVYMHRIGVREHLVPTVAPVPERFLRPAGSPALGPHSYLFAGEIVACERRGRYGDWEPEDAWHLDFVADCGLPLQFRFNSHGRSRPVPHFRPQHTVPGTYVAGLAHLSEFSLPGLYQPVTARVVGMRILNLSPEADGFGSLRDVPFGYRLPLDPDTIRVPFVFMSLDILSIEPLERDHESGFKVHDAYIDLRQQDGKERDRAWTILRSLRLHIP